MLRTPVVKSLQSLALVPRCTVQRTMSTAATKQTATSDKKMSLSERLGGGAGRGKPLAADDPFATFLANAQKKAKASKGKTGRPQKPNRNRQHTEKPGQFDDAVETATGTNAPATNTRPQRTYERKEGENGNNRRKDRKRTLLSNRRPQEQQRSALPKASAFVSKDIDWSSFQAVSHVDAIPTSTDQVVTEDERIAQRLEIQGGDYERYLNVQGLQTSGTLNAEAIERLVGQNATYSLPEKTTFLATLSNAATGGKPAVAKK
ncbi:hypothetical protein INT44_008621 [Umbelopsis vinacea]|uniref:Uncharacterized protein n=1 Tax=Umbelopsis vinacea TaxID=44442 RepID=A0A8H7UDM8_9FUNG|nr:hypothetical protein INT44_008621 [Umbelopsis vinacea]